MRLFSISIVAVAITASCGAPSTVGQSSGASSGAGGSGSLAAPSTSAANSSASSASSAGGADGDACAPAAGDVCNWSCSGFWPPGSAHPPGCMCVAECAPPSGPCMMVGCSGIQLHLDGGAPTGGECSEVQRAPGSWCAAGVGTCDKAGACVPPLGACDAVGAMPIWCSRNEDCADGNPCTQDLCIGTWCANEPEKNGAVCGNGKTCNEGACCAP